jgi:hypothetical protein
VNAPAVANANNSCVHKIRRTPSGDFIAASRGHLVTATTTRTGN